MKRIVSIQDISCIGKCSLTVALPIISSMGVETAIVPTAVLSTHTAFTGYTFQDLTAGMEPIFDHWAALQMGFDAIYTGYLGSFEQIHLMQSFADRFRTGDTLLFVDPAMGDNGKLYPGFDQAFALEMAKLVAMADVCVPNLTEACMMLEVPYRETTDEGYYRQLLQRLCDLGARSAVLTGVCLQPDREGVMAMERDTGKTFFYDTERVPKAYHGTGDVFASACVGALTRGTGLPQALTIAHDFTAECIRRTMEDPSEPWYGVNFEEAIGYLLARLEEALR